MRTPFAPHRQWQRDEPATERLVRQLGDGGSYAFALVRWGAVVSGTAGNARPLKRGGHELGIERLGLLPPDDVDGDVAGDRQQPRRDPAATRIVRAGVLPGAHERLLGNILGGALVAHDRQHQAVHPRLETAGERRRGVRVAGRQTGQEGLVRES